ncbi:MAG: hypothetical protein P9L94_08090 [Candidatus Hinthialibacter antarcticus]|nr:hypothetical protein [Candidatus Hinthialibacter antarcticus]
MVLLIGSLASSLALYSLFIIGYYAAWNDFKPKRVSQDDDYALAPRTQYELTPTKRTRALTDRELGLIHIDDSVADPAIQRRDKMREAIKNYAAQDPEAAAEVLRSWISQP